jgi:hypothetical protein
MNKIPLFTALLFLTLTACSSPPTCQGDYFEYQIGVCCLDANHNNACDADEQKPATSPLETDLSTVHVQLPRTTYQLHLSGNGGTPHDDVLINVRNPTDIPIYATAQCVDIEFALESYYVHCGDSSIPQRILPKEEATLKLPIFVGTEAGGQRRQSQPGFYNAMVEVSAYPDPAVDADLAETTRVAVGQERFFIEVICAAGCCTSGRYNFADCQ